MTHSLPDLLAPGGDPRLDLFGQFVGSWSMAVTFFDEAGETTFEGVGRWDFAWILDGLAVQDVLQYDTADRFPAAPGERRMGTTLRTFVPSTGRWRQLWLSPRAELFLPMEAEAAGTGILITGVDMDGSLLRWEFGDITPTSFTWTGRTSPDGTAWRVEQLMRGTRIA